MSELWEQAASAGYILSHRPEAERDLEVCLWETGRCSADLVGPPSAASIYLLHFDRARRMSDPASCAYTYTWQRPTLHVGNQSLVAMVMRAHENTSQDSQAPRSSPIRVGLFRKRSDMQRPSRGTCVARACCGRLNMPCRIRPMLQV